MKEEVYYPLGKTTFRIFLLQPVGVFLAFLLVSLIIFSLKTYLSAVIGFGIVINWMSIGLFLVGLLIFTAGLISKILEYKTSRVMFDSESFHIVRGALSKEETVLPYRRIQAVEVKQPFLYRILGVGHVDISTTTDLEQPNSGDSETDQEVIPIIDYQLAKTIEKTLTDRAEIERIKNV